MTQPEQRDAIIQSGPFAGLRTRTLAPLRIGDSIRTETDRGWQCRNFQYCGNPADGIIKEDPYDLVSESPILQPVAYCLGCYSERVNAALKWLMGMIK